MRQRVFNILISIAVFGLGIIQYLDHTSKKDSRKITVKVVIDDKEPSFIGKSPKEGLMEALLYYDIKHPEIVYAQAVLETGNFKSQLCVQHNNLFGLYNSKQSRYFKYNHWSESVKGYKNMIQNRYKPPNDYYKFLNNIGYAEDPRYINKLKRIVNRNDKRRTSDAVTISNQAK